MLSDPPEEGEFRLEGEESFEAQESGGFEKPEPAEIDLVATGRLILARRELARGRVPIEPGATLRKSFFAWFRASEFSPLEVMRAFTKKPFPGPRIYYPCEVRCSCCGQWREEPLPKHRIQEFLERLCAARFTKVEVGVDCTACVTAAKKLKEAQKREEGIRFLAEAAGRREAAAAAERAGQAMELRYVLTRMLRPGDVWPQDIAEKQRVPALRMWVRNPDQVALAVRALSYADFLATPYWQAVAWEVKSRAGFRCALCNAAAKGLAAHHRRYEFHGLEHTEDGLNDLICLCPECHGRFHYKLPGPWRRGSGSLPSLFPTA